MRHSPHEATVHSVGADYRFAAANLSIVRPRTP